MYEVALSSRAFTEMQNKSSLLHPVDRLAHVANKAQYQLPCSACRTYHAWRMKQQCMHDRRCIWQPRVMARPLACIVAARACARLLLYFINVSYLYMKYRIRSAQLTPRSSPICTFATKQFPINHAACVFLSSSSHVHM